MQTNNRLQNPFDNLQEASLVLILFGQSAASFYYL